MYIITPAAYTITHSYFNSMQQGIQAAHAIAELMLNDITPNDVIHDWVHNYKTIKMLSGGSGDTFKDNAVECERLAEKYDLPFASFREPDVCNMTTSVCLIVSPMAVELVSDYRKDIRATYGFGAYPYTDSDHPLVDFLKDLKSAK